MTPHNHNFQKSVKMYTNSLRLGPTLVAIDFAMLKMVSYASLQQGTVISGGMLTYHPDNMLASVKQKKLHAYDLSPIKMKPFTN